MKIKAYSRDERKQQIMTLMAIEVQHGRVPKLTMYQIAKRLEMSPSSHLMKILKEMDEGGQLDSWWVEHRPNKTKLIFTLAAGTYEPTQKQLRKVTYSMSGKKLGELLI